MGRENKRPNSGLLGLRRTQRTPWERFFPGKFRPTDLVRKISGSAVSQKDGFLARGLLAACESPSSGRDTGGRKAASSAIPGARASGPELLGPALEPP